MIRKSLAAGLILLVAGVMLFVSPCFGEQPKVMTGVTTGKRQVIAENVPQAKQDAVSDALDLVLLNAVSTLMPRQVLASNLDFIYNTILSRTSDYIVAYRVLGGIENNGDFLVGVESKVNLSLLEKKLTDARIINPNKDKPSVLLFIAEKMSSDLLPKYWWADNPVPYQSVAEDILRQKMIQERFFLTGMGQDRPDPSFYNVSFSSIYDVASAKNLGRQMKADMIVFGKASSVEAINRMGEEKTFNARIDLEAYLLETGEKVVTSKVEAAVKSDTQETGQVQAIIKAAGMSAEDLIYRLDEFWSQYLRKEHSFDVHIEGKNFLPRFLALKRRMQQMPGIENMQPKEMGSSSAVMEVFFKGKASKFADTVMLKTFDTFGLEILDVSDTLVTIRFIEKGENFLFETIESNPQEPEAESVQ